MLESLKKEVYEANLQLPALGLVTFTWGNVSGIDRETGLVVIKPSGVAYEELSPDQMVVVNLAGEVVEGTLRPSSDTKTHVRLYQAFPEIRGIVHTHSLHAVAFAQAMRPIACLGTTHCDTFAGTVPCIRELTAEEIEEDYEGNTGHVIVEEFQKAGIDPMAIPGCVCAHHGPFTWGTSPMEAVVHAKVLEEVAHMNALTVALNPDVSDIPAAYLNKHFSRKHGKEAYYGQN